MAAIITLLSDFGLADGYAGLLHGVILGINPQATVVDLTHEVPPQDIAHAAYVLATSYRYFPAGTIHLAIVDPGVGSERAALAAQANGQFFVAPDNGLLSYVLAEGSESLVRLTVARYWLPHTSHTFHGRDIFAPVAAHLSLGLPLSELGEPLARPVRLPGPQPVRRPDGVWVAHVIHIDRFGNLITDLRPGRQTGRIATARLRGQTIAGLAHTYADVAPGALALLIGSAGYLEIAVRNGSARAELGAGVGDEVLLFAPTGAGSDPT